MKKLILFILFFSQVASAKFDNFGYEFELTPRQLSNIVDWIEVDLNIYRDKAQDLIKKALQTKKFNKKLQEEAFTSLIYGLEHYAENTDAVNALPTEVKDALLKGLNTDMKIETAKNLEQASRQKQKPTYEKDGGLWLPSSSGFKSSGGLFVPENLRAKTDFAELQRRWSEIPLEKKLEIVDLNLLPRATRAAFMIYEVHSQRVRFKENAPQVLKDLEFVNDLEAWEFRPKEPIRGYEKFVSHIKAFSQMVGLYSQVFSTGDPRDFRNDDVSLHVHMSKDDGYNLYEVAQKLNFLLFVRNLARGDHSDLKARSRSGFTFGYHPDVTGKGRLRLISSNRIEARLFIDGLEEEMEFYNSLIEMNEQEVLRTLDAKIKSLITPEMTETVFKSEKSELTISFLEYLDPQTSELYENELLKLLPLNRLGNTFHTNHNKFRAKIIVQEIQKNNFDVNIYINTPDPKSPSNGSYGRKYVEFTAHELDQILAAFKNPARVNELDEYAKEKFEKLVLGIAQMPAFNARHFSTLEKILSQVKSTSPDFKIPLFFIKKRLTGLTCERLF